MNINCNKSRGHTSYDLRHQLISTVTKTEDTHHMTWDTVKINCNKNRGHTSYDLRHQLISSATKTEDIRNVTSYVDGYQSNFFVLEAPSELLD